MKREAPSADPRSAVDTQAAGSVAAQHQYGDWLTTETQDGVLTLNALFCMKKYISKQRFFESVILWSVAYIFMISSSLTAIVTTT